MSDFEGILSKGKDNDLSRESRAMSIGWLEIMSKVPLPNKIEEEDLSTESGAMIAPWLSFLHAD